MALALYRKYRSATFAEVIGQEHVTGPLTQALTAGRINHAYLFSGPRGCGKTSSARILARSLNCVRGPTATPCGECGSCQDLAPNGSGSIDVIEIDAASHGGVDDARDLRERAYYAPARDRFKVYIIDEAHMVTTQGFNALLKLVEEPPDFLVFIFATTEPDKVLQTIRSRTHHYPFRLIAPSVLRAHLEHICQAEGAVVEPAALSLVVRAAGGSARDALSILDQLLAGADQQGVTYQLAVGLLGVTDAALLDALVDALAVADARGVYEIVGQVVEAGHDPRRFAADVLTRFRDLMMLAAVPDAVAQGLIDYPDDQAERMAEQSRRIGPATLVRFGEITHTTLTDMRGTTSPRLVLELLCARMLLPDAASDSAALLQRIEGLERRQSLAALAGDRTSAEVAEVLAPVGMPALAPGPAVTPKPAATPIPAATPEPAVSATPATPAVPPEPAGGPALRQVWDEVMRAVQARSKVKWAMMSEVRIATVSGDQVTLLAPPGLAKRIADEANLSVLRDALVSVVPGDWQLSVKPAEPGGMTPSVEPAASQAEVAPIPPVGAGSGQLHDDALPGQSTPVAASPTGSGVARQRPRPAPPEPASDLAVSQRPEAASKQPWSDDEVDEAADVVQTGGRTDPADAAVELLQSTLGAYLIDPEETA